MTATDHALELVAAAAQAARTSRPTRCSPSTSASSWPSPTPSSSPRAGNDRQVKAIVDEVEDKLREIGAKPIRREGQRDGRWVLLDYGEIVVHVQHEEERPFYALERLWRDCPLDPAARRRRPPLTREPHAGPAAARPDRLEPRAARPGPP